jgi:hypothetical protein
LADSKAQASLFSDLEQSLNKPKKQKSVKKKIIKDFDSRKSPFYK